ncbi:MAG: alpha-L-rhamnosidase N-terminal domain-containing protein [Saprospiraceae bacterium]|nr:alpha-L-rhamnosidase N-terminal domain-containing protein [Lewinella sp.]
MKNPHLIFALILLLSCNAPLSAQSQPPSGDAAYVWTNDTTQTRFQLAYFRTSFELTTPVDDADIYLFADSRYHLLVNGNFVNFGPARFYPEHPEYDHYDLTPFLQAGENVIALKVLNNGTSTFQLRRHRPGLIVWGNITTEDQDITLTTPGNWKAYQSKAYDAQGPRMNFALGPMEVYDANADREVAGWEQADYEEDDHWQDVVKVDWQESWGPLVLRSIPPLSQQEYRPQRLVEAFRLEEKEEIYSFQVLQPDLRWIDSRTRAAFFAYTNIYSPKEQEVKVGVTDGQYFLNGKGPLSMQAADPVSPQRRQLDLSLKKGWNYLLIRSNTIFGKWAFLMSVPKNLELALSPSKTFKDPVRFRIGGPFLPEEADALDLYQMDLHQKLETEWLPRTGYDGGNPAIDMSWRSAGASLPFPGWVPDDIAIADGAPTGLVYDFRYKKLGRIAIDYEAPAGTILDVGFTEDLLGRQVNIMKRNGLYMTARHITAGGSGRMETFKPYGLRYLQVNIRHATGPVTIKKVRVINQIYPFKQIGEFACSDPLMDQIWQMGWRTLRVCAEDSYTDTPFRERGLYAGDMLPQMAVTLAGSGDLRLVKRSIALFQDMYRELFYEGKTKHPDEIALLEDYPLLTLEALMWYVDRTGDLAFAEELFPHYEKLIGDELEKRNEQGLIHNDRVFIEWTQITKQDVTNTAFQAILTRACQNMARLAGKLDQPQAVSFYTQAAAELSRSIKEELWDPAKMAYRDGIQQDTTINHHYPISSVWPYLAGITDTDQNGHIFPYIAEELKDIGSISRRKKTTPYGSFYVLAALYDQGMPEVAEQFVRKHWGEMIYKHDDTTWENFDDTGIGTLSHAWSAAPTYYLTTQVLGVDLGWPHPSDPDQLIIAPQTASINWAKGTVPHPRGEIHVSWEIRGNHLWMECEVPQGINWEVAPKGRLADLELWVNGVKQP